MCFINSEVLEWLSPHLSEEGLPELIDFAELDSNVASVSKEPRTRKVTLVLDLDETLVHSTMEHCDDADFTFPVFFDTKEHMVYVKKRPHVHMFLEKMAEMFEVVIFTASQSVYADQLLDMLDPGKKLFARRFFRESCVFTDRSYTKDLTVVGVDLAKVAIIDNTPEVFQLQVNNGIPIESWYNDPSDEALPRLIPFLETLAVADDVRPIIAKKFGNTTDS
jgi:Dullard-like phosphatase family protein